MAGIEGKEDNEADNLRKQYFKYVQKNYRKELESLEELIYRKGKVKLSDEEIKWSKVASNKTRVANEIEEIIRSGKKLTDKEISRMIITYMNLNNRGLKPEVLDELKTVNMSPQKIEYIAYMDKKENVEENIKIAQKRLERFNKELDLGKKVSAKEKEVIEALDAFVNKKDLSYENAQKIWGKDFFDDKFSNIVAEQQKEKREYFSKSTKEEKKETHIKSKDDLHKGEDIKSKPKNGDLFIVNAHNRKQVYVYYENKADNEVGYISLKGKDIKKVPKYNNLRDKQIFLKNISKDILKTSEVKVGQVEPLNLNIDEFSKNISLEKMIGISSFEENGKDMVGGQKQLGIDVNEIKQHYKIAVEVINKNKDIEEIDFDMIKRKESDIVLNSSRENALVDRLNLAATNSEMFNEKIAELSDQLKNFEVQFGDDLNNSSFANHNGNMVIEYSSMNDQISIVGTLDENNKAIYGLSIKDHDADTPGIVVLYDSKKDAIERYEALKNEETPTYSEALFKNAKISDYDRDCLIDAAKSYISKTTLNENNKDTISENKQIAYAHKAQNITNGLYQCVTEYKTCNRPENSTFDDLYKATHSENNVEQNDFAEPHSDSNNSDKEPYNISDERAVYKIIEDKYSSLNADGEMIVDEEAVENECKARGINIESWDESLSQAQQSDHNPEPITEAGHEDHEEMEYGVR
jgi:hypothetical protein